MNILDRSEDIKLFDFPKTQYIQEEKPKSQIYLHHTAGNSDPFGVFEYWLTNQEKIATCIVIGGKPKKKDNFIDGQIVQGFPSKEWAYHLGLRESTFNKFDLPYKSLDKLSIGIEICNWGQLTRKNSRFYSWSNTIVPDEEVIELQTPFRGFKYFHNYTDAQIVSVEKLLRFWGQRYSIPLNYHDDIFDVNTRALNGEPGVFTHCSVRFDKIDIYPHPKLVEMLKSL